MTVPSYLVQQPRQARSRETMNQMLDAAAQILEIKTFEDLTIVEVVEKAGTSVGAFYGRFRDKDGLLQALDERFFQVFERAFGELVSQPGFAQRSISFIVRNTAAFMAEQYSRNQGLLRSLNLKARLYGDSNFKERERRAWNELFPKLHKILLTRRAEIRHPNPSLAIELGFKQMFYTMREIMLWEPLRGSQPYETDALIAELSRACLAYLDAKGGSK
jgi:AcrR family transcriptional regulator